LKEDTEILYNFVTNENFRGQGLYPYLLQNICNRNNKNKIIYILSNNTSSRKGILKANFKLLGLIRGINKGISQRLISSI
jgi:ribonucleotide monophosphatase NagD (HAD superfamily)